MSSDWGLPKLGDIFLGVPVIRIVVFWGVLGSPSLGKLPYIGPTPAAQSLVLRKVCQVGRFQWLVPSPGCTIREFLVWWTPHPVIMTIGRRDNGNYTGSSYILIMPLLQGGVHLSYL